MLAEGTDPHAMVVLAGAVIVGNAAGVTVIVLLPVMVLLHASVNVHVSVNVPPHPVTVPVLTAVTDPDIKHVPDDEFEYVTVGIDGIASQATVTFTGGDVNTTGGAGKTVIVLLPLIVLLHASVNVHVSVSVPPQLAMVPVLTAKTFPDIKQLPDPEFV